MEARPFSRSSQSEEGGGGGGASMQQRFAASAGHACELKQNVAQRRAL